MTFPDPRPSPQPSVRRPWRFRFPAAWLLAAALVLAPFWAWAQGTATVQGRIVTGDGSEAPAGATVVLLQFQLDDQGKPSGGPVARQEAGPGGKYRFAGVQQDAKAVYQLGARVGGRLVSSRPFSFPGPNSTMTVDLTVPKAVRGFAGLEAEQALFVLSPGRGELEITEVLHVRNPGTDVLDGSEEPLHLHVPPEATALALMRPNPQEVRHDRLGDTLRLFTEIPPGNATIAFRYFLSAALGSATVEKTLSMPLKNLRVMAPQGLLRVKGDGLERKPAETVDKISYDIWEGAGHPARASFSFAVAGVPPREEIFAVPLVGFLLVAGGVVWWFLRRRLRPAAGKSKA